jgi:pimeloyl-ACP methyl ester carboxylesterase
MPYLQTKDKTAIYYYDWGTGKPVVLIHGWPLSSASWEAQARVLAENGYRVIAYDRRGFGRSDWAATGYDYNTLASDLNELMEALDLRSATLVGFSMGGGEVARYLATYGSERVRSAVLISAVTPYLLKTDDNPEGLPKETFDGIVEKLEQDRPDFLKAFGKMFYGVGLISHPVSEAFLEFSQEMALTASPLATIKLVRAWSETDFRGDLAKITIPTLIIHGTGDKTVPIENSARRAVTLLANAELLEYEGEPHGLNATAPKKLNDDLLAFLGRPLATAAL